MLEVTFQVTGDGSETRPVLVRVHDPFRNPEEHKWPWGIVVDVEGRPYTTYGMDPLNAIENASRHAALLLHGVHGAALNPPIELTAHESK